MTAADTYSSKLPPRGQELNVSMSAGVFRPTYTSELCIQAIFQSVKTAGVTLDLGCGCGIVGIAAFKMGLANAPLYASDLSAEAMKLTRKNAAVHEIPVEVRTGSIFEPWKGMKFDLIVDDISAISEELALVSPWYSQAIPCVSGPEGIALTCQVLSQASEHLREGGALLFPALSLSAVPKLLEFAKKHFNSVEKINSQMWKLPDKMLQHLDVLKRMREEGKINFEIKFGMVLCSTEIYRCLQD